MTPLLNQSFFQKIALGTTLGGTISKNSEKLSQWGHFFVYSITMRNLVIVATSSKEILETINFFQILQNREISWQRRRLGVSGWSVSVSVERNGTHLSTK